MSHVLNNYRAICDLDGAERDNRATTILRYANAVLMHWRVAELDDSQLESVAELVAQARATYPVEAQRRLLRDLDFAHARFEENVAIWRPEEHMMPLAGMVFPPVGVNLARMSGAPVLALTNNDLFGWHLAGVVYEASRDLMEMLEIVRAHFISEDGMVTG